MMCKFTALSSAEQSLKGFQAQNKASLLFI